MDYKKDISYDRFYLDQEIEQHSCKYSMWLDEQAKAIKQRDLAKEKLELVKAQLDTFVRSNISKCKLVKGTETEINNWIVQQEDYKNALSDKIEAEYNMNLMNAAIKAFDARKKMIELDVQGIISGLWSRPKEPKEIKDNNKEYRNDRCIKNTESIESKLNESVKKRE